jgi:hypothetical protein
MEGTKGAKNVKFEEPINPFKTTELDEIPSRDVNFASEEFNQMYIEHVRRKEEIRKNIEAKTREKHFLEQLNPSDVAYMFQKKHEFNIKQNEEQFDKKYVSPKKKYESPKKQNLIEAYNVAPENVEYFNPFENMKMSAD